MSAMTDFDGLLASVLDDGPQAVSSALLEPALITARGVAQRRPRLPALDGQAWPVTRRWPGGWSRRVPARLGWGLLIVLTATVLVGAVLVGAALVRDDGGPTQLESTFFRHFEYALPSRGAMHVSGVPTLAMVAWAGGPDTRPSLIDEVTQSQPKARQVRGVVIGRGGEAWSHGDYGRFMLRTKPAEFLADLRDIAETPMGPVSQTQIDGRPALAAMLPGTGGSDIHVEGRMQGLSGTYTEVDLPSRLIVADIDGDAVFILIWARTDEELVSWLPLADEFVQSIHFVAE